MCLPTLSLLDIVALLCALDPLRTPGTTPPSFFRAPQGAAVAPLTNHPRSDLAFSPAVQHVQSQRGSRAAYARLGL